MDNDINPTLLLGIIGGFVLFVATTVINGTIWVSPIERTAFVRGIDSAGDAIPPTSGHDERDTLFRTGNTAHWAVNRRSNRARSVPADCVRPALGPIDELLDIVCQLDL